MLAAEVESIDWEELESFGLDDMDLGEILAEAERGKEGEADAEPQIDKAEELNKTWKVKAGDLWLIGSHRLLCGDSTKAEDVAKALNAAPVSMIHADPPYFGKVDEAWDNDFNGYEQFLDFLDSVFALWIPKTMDRGTSAWWCAPDFVWHIEERLRKYAAVFNHIVWTKGKSLGTTVSVKDMRRWRPRSERLLLCEKQHSPDALLASFNAKTAHIAARSAYSSIIDRLVGWRESSGLSLKQIDACLGTSGMGGHYFGRSQWALPTKEAWDKLRPLFSARGVDIGEWDAQRAEFDAQRAEFDAQRAEFDAQRREFDAQRREFDAETADNLTDVWEMSAPSGEERPDHPTPKPLALVSKLLSAHTRPDDLIADPFLGSGTTMVAAQNLGRKCYGLEISPAYCAVILQRMEDAFPGIEIRKADA
jgi:site-specific DNA-methyltransferase (adenine-specific)